MTVKLSWVLIFLATCSDLSLQSCFPWSSWSPSLCRPGSEQTRTRTCTPTSAGEELCTSKIRLCPKGNNGGGTGVCGGDCPFALCSGQDGICTCRCPPGHRIRCKLHVCDKKGKWRCEDFCPPERHRPWDINFKAGKK